MQLLLESDNYGERKGAAYGLAGLVRGLGITALKQQEIMFTLEEAVKDKKNPRKREGIIFVVVGSQFFNSNFFFEKKNQIHVHEWHNSVTSTKWNFSRFFINVFIPRI